MKITAHLNFLFLVVSGWWLTVHDGQHMINWEIAYNLQVLWREGSHGPIGWVVGLVRYNLQGKIKYDCETYHIICIYIYIFEKIQTKNMSNVRILILQMLLLATGNLCVPTLIKPICSISRETKTMGYSDTWGPKSLDKQTKTEPLKNIMSNKTKRVYSTKKKTHQKNNQHDTYTRWAPTSYKWSYDP